MISIHDDFNKDILDYAVAAGVSARVIKMMDPKEQKE